MAENREIRKKEKILIFSTRRGIVIMRFKYFEYLISQILLFKRRNASLPFPTKNIFSEQFLSPPLN